MTVIEVDNGQTVIEIVDGDTVVVLQTDVGVPGPPGPPGSGGGSVPDGGDTGWLLTKLSDADGDANWEALTVDGSQVTSGTIADARIASTLARDSEVSSAVAGEATARDAAIALAVANLIASAPGVLDTLNEIAAALGDDPNFATTITTLIATKVAKSLYDANTILAANADDTPGPVTVAEQTILGRITGGNITALTPSQIRTLLALVIGTDVEAHSARLDTLAGTTDTGTGAIVRSSSPAITTPTGITKSDVGLDQVDNTSDATKNAAAATLSSKTLPSPIINTGVSGSAIDTDAALAANSDTKLASQKAVKAYIDGLLAASDAVVYKGVVDASANPNYPAASAGHLYRISVAGKIGGASGVPVEVGDTILCLVDNTASGNQATVGTAWNVIQANIDGAVVGPASSTASNYPAYSGTSGKVLSDSGIALGDATKIRGNNVDATAPTVNAELYIWDNDAAKWVAKSLSGDITIDKTGAATLVGTAAVEAIIRANAPNQLATPTANFALGGFKITGLADATAGTDALNRETGDARYQPLAATLTALAQGGGWLLDANTWTVHVVPTQASMTTIVAANTIGHAGLTYTNGDAVIVTGLANTTGPTNGGLYYIVGQTSTTVQLAIAPGGSAIVFAGTADTTAVTLTGVNQFTVAVDATGYLGPGDKASYNDGGVDYGVIHSVKNNAGTTTVTLIPNNDYSIANATLTAPRYSYFETPVGFPPEFNFTPILTGYTTAGPSLAAYRWTTVGRQMRVDVTHLNTATSNSTTHTISLPCPSFATGTFSWVSMILATDNATAQAGSFVVGNNANVCTVNGKAAGGNTASSTSASPGYFIYAF